jgi:hypothetical protein
MKTAEFTKIHDRYFAGKVIVIVDQVVAVEQGHTEYAWNPPSEGYGRSVETSVICFVGGSRVTVEGTFDDVMATLAA